MECKGFAAVFAVCRFGDYSIVYSVIQHVASPWVAEYGTWNMEWKGSLPYLLYVSLVLPSSTR